MKKNNVVYIDDYAHHPEELRALITSAKSLFRGKKCTVIFQPHLFTRTRDFADGFGETLSLADEVILLPIYPARELPIEGVTSDMIADRIKGPQVKIMPRDEGAGTGNNRRRRRYRFAERTRAGVIGKSTGKLTGKPCSCGGVIDEVSWT